jgi:hypothetical protein
MPHGFRAHRGAFGVRQLAAAFEGTLEKHALWAVFESGSELPHSEGSRLIWVIYGRVWGPPAIA